MTSSFAYVISALYNLFSFGRLDQRAFLGGIDSASVPNAASARQGQKHIA